MKKIFIVFLTILIMVTCLALPAAAAMPDTFGDYNNLIDPSNRVNAHFYTSSTDFIVQPFYSVSLKPDTDYTFISTSGSSRFYIGSSVINTFYSCYSFDSLNYIYIPYDFSYGDYGHFTISSGDSDGVIDINYVDPLSRDYYFLYCEFSLEPGTYYFNDFSSSDSGVRSYIWYKGIYYYSGDSIEIVDDSQVECRLAVYSSFNSSVTLKPMLTKDKAYDYFIPGYSTFYFIDEYTSVFSFRTSDHISGIPSDGLYPFLLGINDFYSGDCSTFFSTIQSSENEFYLIEGKLSADQISDIISGNQYQDGYNSGYDQGYKEGEYDGLNSSKFMNSTLLTTISAPFVIVSSALDFDILGINFYNILKVLFTLLLVAFVVNKLKGRE